MRTSSRLAPFPNTIQSVGPTSYHIKIIIFGLSSRELDGTWSPILKLSSKRHPLERLEPVVTWLRGCDISTSLTHNQSLINSIDAIIVPLTVWCVECQDRGDLVLARYFGVGCILSRPDYVNFGVDYYVSVPCAYDAPRTSSKMLPQMCLVFAMLSPPLWHSLLNWPRYLRAR